MKKYNFIALALLVIGALNYAVCSVFDVNVFAYLSFGYEIVQNIIYFVVGLAGFVIMFQMLKKKEE